MAGRAFIGISGWRYAGWRGVFYPKGMPQRRELEHASRCFSSVEINGTFYSLQRPESFERWRDETPDGFVFAVKGSRFITHMLKLRGVEAALANFFAQGVLGLREKLGPILWQLPPVTRFDEARLAAFFELLPRDTRAAARLARRHDARLRGRALVRTDASRPLRHALEIRHASFVDERFLALLREHDVALVVADTAGRWPLMHDVTSDFVYARLHGDEELYTSGYTDAALDAWAERTCAWLAQGLDVHAYFDNDAKVHAPFDAAALARRVGAGCPAASGLAHPGHVSVMSAEERRVEMEQRWRRREKGV